MGKSSRLLQVSSPLGYFISSPASLSKPWICQRCLASTNTADARRSRTLQFQQSSLLQSQYKDRPIRVLQGRKSYSSRTETDAKYDLQDELPSREEGRRSHLSKRFSSLMDHMQSNIFIAGQRLNDLTGYSGIEVLKQTIERQEQLVEQTRAKLQDARNAYSNAITQRSSTQREVNDLLQRKHAWSPSDLERFTTLYRSDHANEQAESTARDALTSIEKASEETAAKLSSSILARYHEEQIWSDKIRRMSTWGTWGLMGVNVLLFLIFQIGVEPWRRKRLVKGFEEKVIQALARDGSAHQESSNGIKSLPEEEGSIARGIPAKKIETASLPSPESIAVGESTSIAEDSAPQPAGPAVSFKANPKDVFSTTTSSVRNIIRDLLSDRPITVRRVDMTTAIVEATMLGATVVGLVTVFFRAR